MPTYYRFGGVGRAEKIGEAYEAYQADGIRLMNVRQIAGDDRRNKFENSLRCHGPIMPQVKKER
jgi:hypothetical protein